MNNELADKTCSCCSNYPFSLQRCAKCIEPASVINFCVNWLISFSRETCFFNSYIKSSCAIIVTIHIKSHFLRGVKEAYGIKVHVICYSTNYQNLINLIYLPNQVLKQRNIDQKQMKNIRQSPPHKFECIICKITPWWHHDWKWNV